MAIAENEAAINPSRKDETQQPELKPEVDLDSLKAARPKRGRKKKQLAGFQLGEAASQIPEIGAPPSVQLPLVAPAEKRPKRKKMPSRPKLQKFDYILLQLLKEGRNSLVEVILELKEGFPPLLLLLLNPCKAIFSLLDQILLGDVYGKHSARASKMNTSRSRCAQAPPSSHGATRATLTP